MIRREVGVAQGHSNGFMAHELLDSPDIYPSHNESRGKGMPQIVEVEILALA